MSKVFYVTESFDKKYELKEADTDDVGYGKIMEGTDGVDDVTGIWRQKKYAKAWYQYYVKEISLEQLRKVLSN